MKASALRKLFRSGFSTATGTTAREGAVSLLDQAVVSGANFLASIIVARVLTREGFGLYELGFTIVVAVTNVQTALVSTPYTVYSPRLADSEQAAYAGSTLIHQLGLSAIAAVLLLAAGLALAGGVGPGRLAPIVNALALAIVLILLREYVRRICFAHLRMKTALVIDTIAMILQLGGLLLLARWGALSAPGAYLITGGACGLASLIGIAATRRLFAPRLARAGQDLRSNWTLGKWALASTLGATASAELYPWFLAAFHGYAATGILGACNKVVFLANPILLGLTNFLGPKAAHAYTRGRASLNRVVTQATFVVAVGMLAFAVLVALLSGWLLQVMYGSKYGGYERIVALLAVRHFITALNLPVNCGLLAVERADIIFRSYLAGATVTLVLGVPLVYAAGIQGAAWAMVASAAATTIFRHWRFWSKP